MSPLFGTSDLGSRGSCRGIDAMFVDAFTKGRQLIKGDPRGALHLACGLMLRGDVVISDVNRNVERLRRELRVVPWNEYGECRT
jgi:tubulin epsilon